MTLFHSTMGQQNPIPLYDSQAPGNKGVEAKEIQSSPNDGVATVTNITRPELWHYAPATDAEAPAIIICPGGGYGFLAHEHEGAQVAEWLTSLGYHAFVLKYRLPDEKLFYEAPFIPLMDARHAIARVRQNAGNWQVNASAIRIMGFSAGGHLAASASVLADEEIPYAPAGSEVRPDFSILIYPVITMTTDFTHMGSKQNLLGENPTKEMVRLFSLEKQVNKNTPPTFILHARDDQAVPPQNTKAYAEALKTNGIKAETIFLPEGGHGFGFKIDSPAFTWTKHLEKWLNKSKKANWFKTD